MNNVTPVILFAFLAVAAAVVMLVSFARREELIRVYAWLAHQFGGHVVKGGLLEPPAVRFVYQGAHVAVDTYSAHGGNRRAQYNRVRISWPDRNERLEVRPERFYSPVAKFLGMEDIEIGDAPFDADFLISGNSPEQVRKLLGPGVQSVIRKLQDLGHAADINFSISGGTLAVNKEGVFRDRGRLKKFVTLALELFDQALIGRAEGIEFLEQDTTAGPHAPVCQICGEEIRGSKACCRSCKTPHHEDCWQYYGACSTYGCRQTKYFTVAG